MAKAGDASPRARRGGDRALAGARLAAHQKKATRLRAYLAFIDESGHLMMPFVAKTWGLRGRTPVLRHRARHRQKISTIAAVTVSPRRRRLSLCFRTHENAAINDRRVVQFLRGLLRQLPRRRPVIIVWDRINSHRSRYVMRWLGKHPRRVRVELLPPYAPELNPVEWFWEHGNCHELANHGIDQLTELRRRVRRTGRRVARDQKRLRGFIHASQLTLQL